MQNDRLAFLRMLASRLERLHVDSGWARRAYGTRGSVIKALEQADLGKPPTDEQLDFLIEKSLELLAKAAAEIPDADAMRQEWEKRSEQDKK